MKRMTQSGFGFWKIVLITIVTVLFLAAAFSAVASAEIEVASAWAETHPTIDGVLLDNEWDDAAKVMFTLLTPELHDCSLYAKNDARNIYLLVVIEDEEYNPFPPEGGPCDCLSIKFDNDNNGVRWTVGDDDLFIRGDAGFIYDGFYRSDGGWGPDTSNGGTSDIVGAVRHTNPSGVGTYSFEFSHPLDTTDDTHDFSLSPGDVVGFQLHYGDGASPGTYSAWWPSESLGHLILAEEPADNLLPVAIITGPDQPVSSGDLAWFFGSNSYDPDGTIVRYEWDFGDGTIIEGLAEPGLEEHRFRGAMGEPKEYTVKLTVKDNKGATASYTDSITVYPLKRYILVYSSLSLLLPPPPPKIMEVTVYYNWVDETEGQDEYIVSEVHLDSAEGLNFALYMFSIKDEGQVIWKKIHKGVGKEDVSFTYPFNVPRDCTKVIGNEHFKGLAVGHNCNLNFLVYGFELGLDLSFFRVSRTIELGPGKQTEVPSIYPEGEMAGILAALSSPAELHIYDSQGNVTGLVNGKIKEEIPNSIYDEKSKTGVIFSPEDINSYSYEIVGSDEGLYGLEVTSVEDGEATTFTAANIPTTVGAIHQYTIDWDALSPGEKGVTVRIDNDGDGIFEQTIITDNTFQLPIASFTYTPENPVVYETITFDASDSYDPDGTITKYEWNFGNGDIIDTTEPIITHSYALAGDYTVNLKVTDDDGGFGDYTTTVTVISAEEATRIIIDQLEVSVSIVPAEAPEGVSQKIESAINKLEQVIDFLDQGKYCDAIGKLDGVIIQIEGAIDQVNEQRCSIKECKGKKCICIDDEDANELIERLEQAKQGAIAIRDLISAEHPECA